tara:strand:- start:36 stop:455 length:420 start_codon:yes stop_codon:yes gene_type:complete
MDITLNTQWEDFHREIRSDGTDEQRKLCELANGAIETLEESVDEFQSFVDASKWNTIEEIADDASKWDGIIEAFDHEPDKDTLDVVLSDVGSKWNSLENALEDALNWREVTDAHSFHTPEEFNAMKFELDFMRLFFKCQ